jgi:hypothetical protein
MTNTQAHVALEANMLFWRLCVYNLTVVGHYLSHVCLLVAILLYVVKVMTRWKCLTTFRMYTRSWF